MLISQKQKAARFVSLHSDTRVFAIPNPWDIGSAKILEGLGCDALATTSSGFAQTLGRMDGKVTLEEKLEHCRALASATSIPITADMENGFGDSPEEVSDCIRQVAATGVVGASVEDFSGNTDKPIYDLGLAVERIAAAVEAADSLPFRFMITARAEQQLRGGNDLDETIRRLTAYENVGAHVLYAPALRNLDEVRRVADSVNLPLNVLGTPLSAFSISEIGDAGAKRVSVGGSLARLVAKVLIQSGRNLIEDGNLDWVPDVASSKEVKILFEKSSR